jgi:hypothetical protein
MCGPIAFALPLNRNKKSTLVVGILQYHLGRILVYTFLGSLVGFIGLGIKMIGILQIISILSGIFVILYAWRNTHLFQNLLPELKASCNFVPSNTIGKLMRSNSKLKLFGLGMLNGFLPCGMIYTALIASIITGNPLSSSASMFAFGIGTLPGMIVLTYFTNRLSF